jgi:hypothetical protein
MTMALAGAGATHAATFAQYTAIDGNPNIAFDGSTGDLTASSPTTTVNFNFLAPLATALGPVAADFTMNGQELGAFGIGPLSTALFDGSFEFTYAGAPGLVNGYNLHDGDVLLQGTFSNAGFAALGTAGSLFGADTSFGGSVSYTSDFYSFAEPDQEDFSIALTGIDPSVLVKHFGLTSFSADSAGSFDADSVGLIQGGPGGPIGTPEPATWITMIGGLFGAGLMLRQSRKLKLA